MSTLQNRKPIAISALLAGVLVSFGIAAAGLDDNLAPGALKLRGDGTVDDTQPGVARTSDDIVGGVKRRGDGTIDDTQPAAGAPTAGAPVRDRSFTTVTNPDGTVTITRTDTRSLADGTITRVTTDERTFTESGARLVRSRSDVRTSASGVTLRDKTDVRSVDLEAGTITRTRTDVRRNEQGDIVRDRSSTRERSLENRGGFTRAEIARPDNSGSGRPERAERIDRVERVRIERPERIESGNRGRG